MSNEQGTGMQAEHEKHKLHSGTLLYPGRLTIRLTEEERAGLKALADQRQVTVSEFLRRIARSGLELRA